MSRRRREEIEKLQKIYKNLEITKVWSQSLFNPEKTKVLFKKAPQSFSAYRRVVEKKETWPHNEDLKSYEKKSFKPLRLPSSLLLDYKKKFENFNLSYPFLAGETCSSSRLKTIFLKQSRF